MSKNTKVEGENVKEINFDGLYTLQTARMEDGKEIDTIKRHKKMIEEIYNE